MTPCECSGTHGGRRIVLTGAPGAGKTALLELDKAARALDALRGELPGCCRGHEIPPFVIGLPGIRRAVEPGSAPNAAQKPVSKER